LTRTKKEKRQKEASAENTGAANASGKRGAGAARSSRKQTTAPPTGLISMQKDIAEGLGLGEDGSQVFENVVELNDVDDE